MEITKWSKNDEKINEWNGWRVFWELLLDMRFNGRVEAVVREDEGGVTIFIVDWA